MTLKAYSSKLNTLTEIKSLDLSYNNFSQGLPSSISRLRSLESLRLPRCDLSDLPPWLNTLTELKSLDLSSNNFFHGLPSSISQLISLESLNLSSCDLRDLPPRLNTLTELKSLDLTNNNFSQGLPHSISQLSSLESLNLSSCDLKDLPQRLNTLTRLKELYLSWNSFTDGLPEVISQLNLLESLKLSDCKLPGLPATFGKLKMLKHLGLSSNKIDKLPPETGELKELVILDISHNDNLIALGSQILSWKNLQELQLSNCYSLQSPPGNVIRQGLSAIQQYYKDLSEGMKKELSVTVAVIGKSRSGKTSLIKTMQEGTRFLTESLGSAEQISTKVFNFEKVSFGERSLYFIDFGGQEIYHHAYRLTLRENCIPVVVINMFMYVEEADIVRRQESVRALLFNWMAHLYLAHPNMLPPALVLTHKDLLNGEKFKTEKMNLLQYCNDIRDEIRNEENRLEKENFCRIESFGADTDLFTPERIFEVGCEYSGEFTRLRDQLLEQSQRYVMEVPRLWKQVEDVISTLKSHFTTFESLLDKVHESHGVVKNQLEVIIRYLHLSGKLLWYDDIEGLDQHVFHKISAVTDLLNVLYDHDGDSKWDKRRENFKNCKVQTVNLFEEEFEESVRQFKATGVISLVLLAYLIKTETAFIEDVEQRVALAILSKFRILFGSLSTDNEKFIIPHFAQGFQSTLPMTKLDLQFQTDILCEGLALPQYAFHELTVRVLELYPDPYSAPSVHHNGISIAVDKSQVHFTHDAKAGKVTATVAFNVEEFHEAWNYLKKTINVAIEHLRETWRATPLVCIFYCAHCRLTGQQHPEKVINPSWSLLSRAQPEPRGIKMRDVVCAGESVSSVFKFPKDEKRKLKEYVSAKQTATASVSGIIQPCTTSSCPSAFNGSPDLIGLSLVDVCKAISDGSPTYTNTTEIKELFHNTDAVYKMTNPRGRVLIINNNEFHDVHGGTFYRDGSEHDVKHLQEMFSQLHFEVETRENLTSKDMLEAVESVTQDRRMEDYGMFALVILSHGQENDQISGSFFNLIKLDDVYFLLSPQRFRHMAGKPKMVIVQACAGLLKDFGEQHDNRLGAVSQVIDAQHPGPFQRVNFTESRTVPSRDPPTPDLTIKHLSMDDLIVIKASFNMYASMRDAKGDQGSFLISNLVYGLYKHSHDTDVESLFKLVQENVRNQTKDLARKFPKSCYGQLPFVFSTLTKLRKLYLFPGYHGELQAVNDDGKSNWSQVVKYKTRADVPAAPTQLSAKGKILGSSFRLFWEAPREDGGSEVQSFLAQLDEGKGYQSVYDGLSCECSCSNLLPGHKYKARVAARNSIGFSRWSETTQVTTKAILPGPCVKPHLLGKAKAHTLVLKWASPEHTGGSSIRHYVVQLVMMDNTTKEVYRGHATECTVAGLSPGRIYLLQVRAANEVGEGDWSEPLEVISGAGSPEPPMAPVCHPKSAHSMLISWKTPCNNGAEISEYRLECMQPHVQDYTCVFIGRVLDHEVKSLLPNTEYKFRVQAINSSGASPYSESSSAITLPSSPAAMHHIRITTAATSIAVSWDEPNNNGSEILHYNVDYGKNQTLNVTDVIKRACVITGLEPDTVHRIRVQAVNAIGAGVFSSQVKTTTLSLPPAPPHLECTGSTWNSIKLKWTQVDKCDQYTVLMYRNLSASATLVYQGALQHCRVARLHEHTDYQFTISAENSAGEGPESEPLTVRTCRAPPHSLEAPSVEKVAEKECEVSWQAAKPFAGDSIEYRLQLSQQGGSGDYKQVVQTRLTQHQLTGLTPGAAYTVRVCAVRICSDDSDPIIGAYSPGASFRTQKAPPIVTPVRSAETQSRQSAPKSRIERTLNRLKPGEAKQLPIILLFLLFVCSLFMALVLHYYIG
ncbi:uncharacterized protein [Watersipora subatra]|uniref:uncharacterized protein n=1 Tax=Watersipora subatra TaxID=2589382 RepID=UPI00355B5A09